jgi:ATP-dependent Clp protease adaptor protein ClpS
MMQTGRSVVPRANELTAEPEQIQEVVRKKQPRYNVVLWDDDDHSYDYVIRMMRRLFGHTANQAMGIAESVDNNGKAVCLTTTMEHAELKRDQIHAFGRDFGIRKCQGAMSASIEPVE